VKLEQFVHFFLGANRLAELQRNQLSDNEISKKETQDKCCDCRADCAERDVLKNIEGFDEIVIDPSAQQVFAQIV
jgi:hypothetical protein